MDRRGDDHFCSRLFIWMIDCRQPIARPVRPVVGEKRTVTVHVFSYDQTSIRGSVVLDPEAAHLPAKRRFLQDDAQTISGVRKF